MVLQPDMIKTVLYKLINIYIFTLICKTDVDLIYEEIGIRCLIADLSLVPKI